MKKSAFGIIMPLLSSFLFGVLPAYSGQAARAEQVGGKGYLEIECNFAGVDLHACPYDQFERKTIRKFFGLFTSYQESCAGGKFFVGTTPIRPVEFPEGRYTLLIPPGYAWEHKGAIEFSVDAGEKTILLLKLFKRYRVKQNGGPGDSGSAPGGSGGGGSSGGGSGTGGAPGSSPPP